MLLIFQRRTESKSATVLANSLLLILITLQFLQCLFILNVLSFESVLVFIYLLSLGLVAPVFYLYSQHIINAEKIWKKRDYLHLIPALLIALLGAVFIDYFPIAYSITFLSGGIYMMSLVLILYQLRKLRSLFKIEFLLTTCFLGWALLVVIVGLFSGQAMNYLLPAQIIMLSIAIAAAIHIQLNYPHLLSSLEEIVNRQYQTSTLETINSEDQSFPCDSSGNVCNDGLFERGVDSRRG